MNEPKTKTYARILVNFLLTLAGILLIILLGPKLLRFFMPFVIAFIISSIAFPVIIAIHAWPQVSEVGCNTNSII